MISLVGFNGSFKIHFDLTKYIPVKKYNINNVEYYEEWIDSNYKVHRRKTHEKAEGEFTLVFPSVFWYNKFLEFYNTYRNEEDGSIEADFFMTNKNTNRRAYVFLDFEPQNDLPLLADNKSDGFVVTLTERG